MFDTDVFIAGGGPSGIAAALAARQQGFRVTIADAGEPPMDKPCGEGLMPDSLAAAERLGVRIPDDVGFRFRGIRFVDSSHSVAAAFPHGIGRGIRRLVLHSLLIEAAARAGVQMIWRTPVIGMDGNTVLLRDDSMSSRWIIGADGTQSNVRRWAGLESARWNTRRFGYRQHFAIAPWTDYMEIHWAEGCQLYITPVSAGELCVVLVSHNPALRLPEALPLCFEALQDRLKDASRATRERGAITATRRLRKVAHGNVALIGDASGSVDSITGEGLCLSFRQAEILAQCLISGDLAQYNQAHPRMMMRPHLMAKTMLVLDRGKALRQVALGALAAQPWIFRQLLAVHVL